MPITTATARSLYNAARATLKNQKVAASDNTWYQKSRRKSGMTSWVFATSIMIAILSGLDTDLAVSWAHCRSRRGSRLHAEWTPDRLRTLITDTLIAVDVAKLLDFVNPETTKNKSALTTATKVVQEERMRQCIERENYAHGRAVSSRTLFVARIAANQAHSHMGITLPVRADASPQYIRTWMTRFRTRQKISYKAIRFQEPVTLSEKRTKVADFPTHWMGPVYPKTGTHGK